MEEDRTERVAVWFCPSCEKAGRADTPHNQTCNTIEIGWIESEREDGI
jgi:hypothetical protein